jgi:hypothetical protein
VVWCHFLLFFTFILLNWPCVANLLFVPPWFSKHFSGLLPFHERVGLTVSHQTSVDFIIWYVDQTLEEHDSRHKEDLFVKGKAHVSRAIVQIVQYMILTHLVNANTVDCNTILSVCGTTTFPRWPNQSHWLKTESKMFRHLI